MFIAMLNETNTREKKELLWWKKEIIHRVFNDDLYVEWITCNFVVVAISV